MKIHTGSSFKHSLAGCFSVLAFSLLTLAQPGNAQQQATGGEALIKQVNSQISNLNTAQLQQFIDKHPKVEFVDVRLAEEIARQGGLINAGRRTHHIPRGWLEFQIAETVPDLDTPLVLYCGTNRRSPLATLVLQQMGYSNVHNYADGFLQWQQAGLDIDATDYAVGTQLYRLPQKVIDGVYSAIGATAPATYENSGHNNNLSFVIGSEAVLVVNAGDNYLLASALHEEIRKVTDKPVRYVVLENGQGHAMLGMNYWQQQGAEVIAHVDAADEIAGYGQSIYERMVRRNRDKAMGTRVSAPDTIFEDKLELNLGDVQVELLYLGPAHSPGDIVVWLPQKSLVISGDMSFHERLLPVFDHTDTYGWVETWDAFEALNAEIIVPGHGHPTTIDVVRRWTYDYLQYMRSQVAELLENDGSLIDAYKIDQSAYSHLDTFDELAGLNADRIYRAMEFE